MNDRQIQMRKNVFNLEQLTFNNYRFDCNENFILVVKKALTGIFISKKSKIIYSYML